MNAHYTASRISRNLGSPLMIALLGFVLFTTEAQADDPKVVTTIKPVQSLVAAVIGDGALPYRIVPDFASPHTYRSKPSDARALENADLIVWVGPEIETFLSNALEQKQSKARVIELSTIPGLTIHPLREGDDFDDHDHGHHDDHDSHGHKDHGHDDHGHNDHKDHADEGHSDHKHAHDDDHDHDKHKSGDKDDHHHDHDKHKSDHKDGHHHASGMDAHVWLDPENAKVMIMVIADQLGDLAPENQDRYQSNADAAIANIDTLIAQTSADLMGLNDRPFVAFHDAYQYFEKRFGLAAAGTITVNPEVPPGARSLREIKEKIARLGVVCVFAEPQFSGQVVDTVIEGTGAKKAVLDPIGKSIPEGPEQYEKLIKQMAGSFNDCLRP